MVKQERNASHYLRSTVDMFRKQKNFPLVMLEIYVKEKNVFEDKFHTSFYFGIVQF